MKRSEFVKVCAEKSGLSQKDMKEVLEVVGNVILDNMKDEDGVTPFSGIKFASVYRAARVGHNPATGEAVNIPGKYQPKVKFGTRVKETLNA